LAYLGIGAKGLNMSDIMWYIYIIIYYIYDYICPLLKRLAQWFHCLLWCWDSFYIFLF
jgi:hypothetical protein